MKLKIPLLSSLLIFINSPAHAVSDEFRLWSGCISPYYENVDIKKAQDNGSFGAVERVQLSCPAGPEAKRLQQPLLTLPQIEVRGTEKILHVYIMSSTKQGLQIKRYSKRALGAQETSFQFTASDINTDCGNAQFKVDFPSDQHTGQQTDQQAVAFNVDQHNSAKNKSPKETLPTLMGEESKTPAVTNLFLGGLVHKLENLNKMPAPQVPSMSGGSLQPLANKLSRPCLELAQYIEKNPPGEALAETVRLKDELLAAIGKLRPALPRKPPAEAAPSATKN